ncbi:T9SS type A sorting domain-containing protein [Flavobacterium sp.]|uniref:type IX secretion system anionic LPS delivery protein PorZ n=1 Tax=Flavobacterium sp. TaxID=239 RepID=UPI002B4AE7F7|nr:T9SS type A sorting domain-containing protein [Flavobacterium sp.]HLP64080.1 T9SS type A sorting domain-containing protein [Flavobacterium sp.]
MKNHLIAFILYLYNYLISMLKIARIITLLLISIVGFSQKNPQWEGYFSYNNIKDISNSSTSLYAAAENSFFIKNSSTNTLSTFNSVDGFKPDIISSIYYSEQKNILFVGNTNGLVLLVLSDGRVLQKRGIIDEVPVTPTLKNINNFYEYQDKIYISCDYGISVFDLNTLEFGDTLIIGNNGNFAKVFQTTVINNELYAVTQFDGLKKIDIANPFMVDYDQWQVFHPGFWNGIVTFQNQLIIANYGLLYRYDGAQFISFLNSNETINKVRISGNYLVIQTLNRVYVFDQTLQQIAQVQSSQITDLNVTFTSATVLNETIYIGTENDGVVGVPLNNLTSFEIVKPDGPEQNNIFRVKKSSTALWTLYGKYNRTYNPYFPPFGLGQFPISLYKKEEGWSILPYNDIFQAKSLSSLAFNPNNENEVYVSSYFSGLLKIENEEADILYNTTNTGQNGLQSLTLTPPNPTYIDIRINGPVFDKSGNLWMTNNMVDKPLKVLRSNAQWQSYDFTDIIPEAINESYAPLVIDKNNTKWLPSSRNGLIGFNEGLNNKSIVIKTSTEGNLPDTDVRCVAIDARNQLWIGTAKGLRIIQNVDQFLSQDDIQTRSIIILENDLAQELFYEQFILDITVDGANRKWVAIADSGVYLVSSNGQETIYHFTKEDSPLPSNNVNDIEIDSVTGEVFFATDKGLVSFKGSATKPSDDLSGVYVYPNPVRPEYEGTVKISGLTDKANVKITDITGNLVHETTALGGTIEWDTTAFGKYKVASGVYMIFIAAQDGIETKVKKVMIVR